MVQATLPTAALWQIGTVVVFSIFVFLAAIPSNYTGKQLFSQIWAKSIFFSLTDS